jgi:septal ring factor EnvC (AmiA/AmiB activator)
MRLSCRSRSSRCLASHASATRPSWSANGAWRHLRGVGWESIQVCRAFGGGTTERSLSLQSPMACSSKEVVESELHTETRRGATELEQFKNRTAHEHASLAQQLERMRHGHQELEGALTVAKGGEQKARAELKEVKLEVRAPCLYW